MDAQSHSYRKKSLLLSKETCSILPPPHQLPPNNMTAQTTTNSDREQTSYPIPSTALTLHLTLGLNLPLPAAAVRSCLTGATTIARAHDSTSLMPSDAVW